MIDIGTRHHDEEQLQAILDRLDAHDAVEDHANRRGAARHSYRRHPITVRITQPGGGVVTCAVAGREISASGMSFLYRGFLYPGTDSRVTLRRRAGGDEFVEGAVVWCKHVVGPHHLIGVKFRQRIYPRLFVESASTDDDAGAIDPAKLTGTILFIDDQELDRMLFEHHIKRSAMKTTCVSDPDAALAATATGKFDVILCDLNIGEKKGEDLIKQMRANKCRSPIIALTAESSPSRLQAAQQAGASAVVQKPYDPLMLLAVISGMLAPSATPEEAIYSDLAGNPAIDALIVQCLEKIRGLSLQLHTAITSDDLGRVRSLCQTLKGSGSGIGFSTLTEAAKLAITSLDASMSIQESLAELHRLESICKRLSPGKTPKVK